MMTSKVAWIGVVIVCVTTMTLAAIFISAKHADDALRTNDIIQCERGNRVRAWVRWDVRLNAGAPLIRTAAADRLFEILDCEATQAQGKNVPLPPADQIAYIESLIGPLAKPREAE